ncbi:MAG: ribonuclease P protein component [Rhodomicrobiaceae bacterium]
MRLNTLKRRSEFDRLRRGRKWVAKGFILQGAPRDEASPVSGPRFGFAVGSKALKEHKAGETARRPGAVLRNRARRRLKEAVRLLATEHARPDYDYVVVGRRESLHQCFADLLEEFQLAFGKVNRQPRSNDGDAAPQQRREPLPGARSDKMDTIFRKDRV